MESLKEKIGEDNIRECHDPGANAAGGMAPLKRWESLIEVIVAMMHFGHT